MRTDLCPGSGGSRPAGNPGDRPAGQWARPRAEVTARRARPPRSAQIPARPPRASCRRALRPCVPRTSGARAARTPGSCHLHPRHRRMPHPRRQRYRGPVRWCAGSLPARQHQGQQFIGQGSRRTFPRCTRRQPRPGQGTRRRRRPRGGRRRRRRAWCRKGWSCPYGPICHPAHATGSDDAEVQHTSPRHICRQMLSGQRGCPGHQVRRSPLENDPPAVTSGTGPQVDHPVGVRHHRLVMLNHDHRLA